MNDKKISRFILVYFLLIPVMWLLTEVVWGGLHGALFGLKIGMVLRDPQQSQEIMKFLKERGISESTSKEDAKSWIENLSRKDNEEFQSIILKSIKEKDFVSFGSAFAVCVIVFGLIGFISGAFTKTWLFVGILPTISFLLNNPIIRFQSILHISDSQKLVLVVAGQFLACYVFAFTGAFLCNAMKKRKQKEEESLNT